MGRSGIASKISGSYEMLVQEKMLTKKLRRHSMYSASEAVREPSDFWRRLEEGGGGGNLNPS